MFPNVREAEREVLAFLVRARPLERRRGGLSGSVSCNAAVRRCLALCGPRLLVKG